MKAIILAAGQGTRLGHLTNDIPKTMVKLWKKPIINHILETFGKCNIDNISIVTGFKNDTLQSHLKRENIRFYHNENYETTNMVSSLFCARKELTPTDDIVICYSDIVFTEKVLQQLIESQELISVITDKDWYSLWKKRMDDPLSDAETLKLSSNNLIKELGKKTTILEEIQGQYIGLIKFSGKSIKKIVDLYDSMDQGILYDGKDFENMYMTSFIQYLIDHNINVTSVPINGQWLEIDSTQDLKTYDLYKHNYA